MEFEVRTIVDELDEYVSIAGESLLSTDPRQWQMYLNRIGRENVRGVYKHGRLVGGMAFYRMGQWFGGKVLPTAGFSGVAIDPAARGTGACDAMLQSVLRELRNEGMPLASLYASAQGVYRAVGFQQAGGQWRYCVPIASLGSLERDTQVQRYKLPPMDQLNHVATVRAAANNGHLQRSDGLWQRLLCPYDSKETSTYIIGPPAAPEGFAILKPGTREGGVPQPLISTDVAANTPAALKRLVTLIHDHRAMNDQFQWFGGPSDPLVMLASEQNVSIDFFIRWMLRIVDVPSALAGRGYPSSLTAELHLEIHDELLTENSGRWILEINGGVGSVRPGGDGHLSLSVQALGSLFSALYCAKDLQNLGMLDAANEQQIATANAAFAGPPPWIPELY